MHSGFWSRKEARGLACMAHANRRPMVVGTNYNDTVICHVMKDRSLAMLRLNARTEKVTMENAAGTRYDREMYIGEGYRSQRPKSIMVSSAGGAVEEYDRDGKLIARTPVR